MKKILTTVIVMFAVGCGDAEAKAPVTEIQSTPNVVIVPNTKHIDYTAYNREWRKANNMPALKWDPDLTGTVKTHAALPVSDDPTDVQEIVELELNDLRFKEAFRFEFLGKGEGHTFWWRGKEYTTNLLDVVRKPGFTNDDPYIERVPVVPVNTEDLREGGGDQGTIGE